MPESEITFIINGKNYRLSANNQEAIRQIPRQDREQLVALLEAVKIQHRLAASAVQQAAAKVGVVDTAPNYAANEVAANSTAIKPERLGKGDVDDLMARLIMEEKRNKKPGLTQQTIYKWAAGIIAVIVVLVLIF